MGFLGGWFFNRIQYCIVGRYLASLEGNCFWRGNRYVARHAEKDIRTAYSPFHQARCPAWAWFSRLYNATKFAGGVRAWQKV